MRKVVLVGLLAALLSGFYLLSQTRRVVIVDTAQPYTRLYDHQTRGLRGALAAGDGQAYSALAQDPTMARPDVFVAGRTDAAYRYQRPVLGYLAWIASFGQPDREAGAQAGLVVAGAAVAVGACAELLRRRRREPWLALSVLLVPGMQSALAGVTSEPIALAFLSLGLLAWWDQPRRGAMAVALFALAALTRETSLVAIGALAIVEATTGRARSPRERWRCAEPLLVPFAAYAAWVVVLRVGLGVTPFAARANRLSLPFAGIVHDWSRFAEPARSWVWLVLAVAAVVGAAVLRDRDPLAWIVVAFGGFGACMGSAVWLRWQDFARPLLPLYAYGALIVLTFLSAAVARPAAPVAASDAWSEPLVGSGR
jgi:hypothetical protein